LIIKDTCPTKSLTAQAINTLWLNDSFESLYGKWGPGNRYNKSERAVKPIAIGRKNWMFAGNNNAGRTAAIFTALLILAKDTR